MADAPKDSSRFLSEDTVKQLLQQQENNFKSFVGLLIDSFNKRMDDLHRNINAIEVSLENSQKDIDEVKLTLKKANVESIQTTLNELDDRVDYLENQSRRNNIRISGLKEDKNESWAQTEDKVKTMLRDKLDIDDSDVIIERAHRTGKPAHDKPRQVVAKFLNYKHREEVLQSSKKLKGTGIYINEDFSARVMKRRKDQQDKLRQARSEGKTAYFKMDRLIIKPTMMMTTRNLQPFGMLGASASFATGSGEHEDYEHCSAQYGE